MRTLLSILLLLAAPAAVVAQGVVREVASDGPLPPVEEPLNAMFHAGTQAGSEEQGVVDRVLRIAGGAAVGAWVGYMASQVAVGDWEDDSAINRSGWAASGAALGISVGLSIPSGRTPPSRSRSKAPETAPGRDMLTGKQLEKVRSSNLYDAIRSLRPEWLRTRGTGSMRETARGSASGTDNIEINVRPGIPTIRAYLDYSLLGDVDALRSVETSMIGEVRYLTPAEATQRWGAGHLHGAILALTASAP